MERVALYKCVIGLDIHQAQTECAGLLRTTDGSLLLLDEIGEGGGRAGGVA